MFDVRAACEDALQVHPAPLHINPHVKETHDPVELVFPAQGIFFKHLVGTQEGKAQPLTFSLRDTPKLKLGSHQVV